jgi:hypothetical protein
MSDLTKDLYSVLVKAIKSDIYSQIDNAYLPVTFPDTNADRLMLCVEIDGKEYVRKLNFKEIIEFEIESRAIPEKGVTQIELIEFADSLQSYVDMVRKEIDILQGPPPWARDEDERG